MLVRPRFMLATKQVMLQEWEREREREEEGRRRRRAQQGAAGPAPCARAAGNILWQVGSEEVCTCVPGTLYLYVCPSLAAL